MYNKTIISFGFCDIQNNQGLGKGFSLSLRLRLSIFSIIPEAKMETIAK